jgi:hypothetical protein
MTWDAFKQQLKTRFGDPHEAEHAEAKLIKAEQKRNQSVSSFSTWFTAEARKTRWNETTKTTRFRDALRKDIREPS